MRQFGVQMIDNSISSQWWKKIMEHFIRVGDTFEFAVGEKKLPRFGKLLYMVLPLMINMKYPLREW